MIQFTVDDRVVQQALDALSERMRDMRPALINSGQSMADNIRLGFADGRSPWGDRWQKLKEARFKNKNKSRSEKPLLDTGRLRNSIRVLSVDRTSVALGTDVAYAAVHQFGGKAGRGHAATIPARAFMPIRNGRADLPEAWRAELVNALQRHMAGALK